LKRLSFYLQQHSQVLVVFLLGLVFVIGGSFLAVLSCPNWATALVSVGASLVAASVVTYLSPVSEEVYQKFIALGITDVYPSRRIIPNPQWVAWIRLARRNCTLLGIAHENWCRDPEFPDVLRDRLRDRVEVKIFFLDPTSPAGTTRASEDKGRDLLKTIRESIKFMWDLRDKLEPVTKERLKLYVYRSTPSSGATLVDSFMVVTHYLAGFANLTSPALIVKPISPATASPDLYGVYDQNVRAIEEHATEITDGNFATYC
jgi:hypothetical protein